MAFIRPFQPSDTEQTAFICRATLPPSLASSEPGTRLAPYVWTHQYTTLSRATCHVLDDGRGRAVGYVIGTPDVFAFAAAYPRYVREVLERGHGEGVVPVPRQLEVLVPWFEEGEGEGGGKKVVSGECMAQLAYNPRWLLLEGVAGKGELVGRFRGTMHIDMVEEYQGKGWGRKMIEVFIASVKKAVAESEGSDTKLDVGAGIHIGVSGENTKVVPFYERIGFKVYPGGEAEGNVWMIKEF